jgi:hypothetical protein
VLQVAPVWSWILYVLAVPVNVAVKLPAAEPSVVGDTFETVTVCRVRGSVMRALLVKAGMPGSASYPTWK